MRVLIAGGGLGGLTAALALLKSGCEVEVYEQAAELREVGAGPQLSANGTHGWGRADTWSTTRCGQASW
jgi:salicylate hydroxylase